MESVVSDVDFDCSHCNSVCCWIFGGLRCSRKFGLPVAFGFIARFPQGGGHLGRRGINALCPTASPMGTRLRQWVQASLSTPPSQAFTTASYRRGQSTSPMIRIAIADDHAVVRAGLRGLFANEIDFCVVAEASNGHEALEIAINSEVDVLIMDISMPNQSGIEALAAIKAQRPDLPVLILSCYASEHYAPTLLRQGASGYLNKAGDPKDIVNAIHTVYRGRKYIPPEIAHLVDGKPGKQNTHLLHEQLSARELQVFLSLAGGESIGQMARRTQLSVKTISTYRTRVLEKMVLESNSDLTYYALLNNLII